MKLADGQLVESVHIPEEDRGALCVSSQVGCNLACTFCHTGTQKLGAQSDRGGDRRPGHALPRPSGANGTSPAEERRFTNIVMMGMGEPLYNYDTVARALKTVMDNEGIGISRRRITLSTSGVVPMMHRCGEELGVNLAVSLHAVTDDLRDRIVPLNRKYPDRRPAPGLPRLPRHVERAANHLRIRHAEGRERRRGRRRKELVRLLRGIPAKVNLIPFNPWPGAPFRVARRTPGSTGSPRC